MYPEPQVGIPTWYLDALDRAGAVGVVLAPGIGSAPDVLARCDGLLLTGGEDLDPGLYGEAPVAQTYGFDGAVDAWEMALYRAAAGAGVPVLAVCRGMQLVNVAHGGSLVQHMTGHGLPTEGGSTPVPAAVEPGSHLAAALGGELAPVGRCSHHQAVATVGEGLVVVARAADGTVEGLEPDGDAWVVAVQWHPEESAATDEVQQTLFDSFVQECAARL